ncbi:hypothetical protein [Dyella sp. C11]|nr:hypothetical protein [Dyella sp. C11]
MDAAIINENMRPKPIEDLEDILRLQKSWEEVRERCAAAKMVL